MSKLIAIDNIEEGMILSEPIKNKFGQVLLGADVTIQKKHIGFFKTWNIEFISIQSDKEEEEEEFTSEDYDSAKTQLYDRMKWNPRNQNEYDLIELGIFHFAKAVQKLRLKKDL
jgi:hypothetical protein